MSKWEDGLNDLAGGKPFIKYDGSGPPDPIDLIDRKPKYHTRDIEGYAGKWTIYGLLRNPNRSAISPKTFETDKEAEKEIAVMWEVGVNLNSSTHVKPEDITMLMPIPVKKRIA